MIKAMQSIGFMFILLHNMCIMASSSMGESIRGSLSMNPIPMSSYPSPQNAQNMMRFQNVAAGSGVQSGSVGSPLFQPLLPREAMYLNETPKPRGEMFNMELEFSNGERGNIEIEIIPSLAPLGAQRFKELVTSHFYDGCKFFRVIENFIAQFADPLVNLQWKERNFMDDMGHVQSNEQYYISFATSGPNSRTTQLFINLQNNPNLDAMGFTPFGKITKGKEFIQKIHITGEGTPDGPGPDQGKISEKGNVYLNNYYPELTTIKSIRKIEFIEKPMDPFIGKNGMGW